MSNHLAFATVTVALRRMLADAFGDPDVSLGFNVDVSAGRPSAPEAGAGGARAHVFLYHVTPSAALRNVDAPTRRSDGSFAQRPQAAFDLHYLLTFYGDSKDLQDQRMLGRAVQALLARPVLERGYIRSIVERASPSHPQTDADWRPVDGSDLADQAELVRLSPEPLSAEDLSKLWTTFPQVPYGLSMAWLATVVLVDGRDLGRPALPVQSREVVVAPGQPPVVERVEAADNPSAPITTASNLVIRGSGFARNGILVRVGGALLTPAASDVTPTEIHVALAGTPVAAGLAGVAVSAPVTTGAGFESNAVGIVLRPRVTSATGATSSRSGTDEAEGLVQVTVDPPVLRGQRVALILHRDGPPGGATDGPEPSYLFAAPDIGEVESATTFTIPVRGYFAGTYFVRLRVDGADGPLDTGRTVVLS